MAIAPSIFPRGGVGFPFAAPGADSDAIATCDVLWYGNKCVPRVDAASLNTLIAEIVNVVNADGTPYDCDENNNLIQAIRRLAAPLMSTQAYAVPGVSQFIIPPGVSVIQIEAWGGGGGGGGQPAGQVNPANGGGGGEYAFGVFNVNEGDTLDITVGAGGQRTIVGGQNSTAGGQSKVEVVGSGLLISANGGQAGGNGGGAPATGGFGGVGGIGGVFRIPGGSRPGIYLGFGGTWGATAGGSSPRGGTGGTGSTGNGAPGVQPGGGGGGGGSATYGATPGGAGNGGDGAAGLVLLSF